MGEIQMYDHDATPLSRSNEQSTIQSGGGGGDIEMLGGDGVTLKHAPVSSVQKSGGGGEIDMVGMQGLVNRGEHASPYGQTEPTDKGKV